MKIFVTGATGYIGRAVVAELAAAGHAVTGLARSEEKAQALRQAGAQAVVGDINEPASYREHAAEHEAVVHTAFEGSRPAEADRLAVDTLLAAASTGEIRLLIYTSGIWVLGATGDTPAYEDAATDHPAPLVTWRLPNERLVLGAARPTLAAAVIRPGVVYGGSGGLVGSYFDSAEKGGAAKYVGDGTNRVPYIHVQDLARFYAGVVEHRANGIFHAVDGAAERLVDVARAASQAAGKGGAVQSIPIDEARRTLGPFADALALDQIVLSHRTAEIGWRPQHPSFIGEADQAYREWKSAKA